MLSSLVIWIPAFLTFFSPFLPASLTWIMFCFQMLHQHNAVHIWISHRGHELSAQSILLLQRTWQNLSHLVADTFLWQGQVKDKDPDLQTGLVTPSTAMFWNQFPSSGESHKPEMTFPLHFIEYSTGLLSLLREEPFLEPFKSFQTPCLFCRVPRKYRCPK